MTPAARLQAAIDLLQEIEATPRPADAVMSLYFRNRRFIGSKDRAAVAELCYAIMRRHARLTWWLEKVGAEPTPRTRVIANSILAEGRPAADQAKLYDGGKFAPPPWSADERRFAAELDAHTLEHPDMPEAVRCECPEWAEGPLRAALGDRFAVETQAMLEAAPLDLRINTVKTDRETALAALTREGIKAEPTRFSPWGLRVTGRPPLAQTKAFTGGLVEIQDEGSQLVALAVAPKPGHQVVDFCAGAGGKTLALAMMMESKGRVVACDVLEKRLKRAGERFRRAGLHNIEPHPLVHERDPWVKRHKGKFDRVLVDAPCSGAGTWRRNPDSRWRPLGPGLAELVPLQAKILDSAARLVKPGGRLVYATCSLLWDENAGQVAAFLETHPEFEVLPIAQVWAEEGLGAPPCDGPYLALTPARHGADGFFAAVMTRKAPASTASETELEPETESVAAPPEVC
ncbi:MAG TPA: RsmB/NOP family class I SAM-dependent RNA methyltransferase [Azospirillaceae bacterium]|nr:RsmB/NOP family class I SAM-dependent RNA methyltransferase [Azospirillaceae bacterium]HRQ80241.1 RsmB/NOP family class I SAM-dependent RNA methyltransferase [Azospirillaceae bacterium]